MSNRLDQYRRSILLAENVTNARKRVAILNSVGLSRWQIDHLREANCDTQYLRLIDVGAEAYDGNGWLLLDEKVYNPTDYWAALRPYEIYPAQTDPIPKRRLELQQ